MRLKLFGICLVVFCLQGSAFADGVCGEFEEFTTPWNTYCVDMYYIPHVAFGGGWTTTLKGSNFILDEKTRADCEASGDPNMCVVQFTWSLMHAGGQYTLDGSVQNLHAIIRNNKTVPLGKLQMAGGGGLWVKPQGSVELELLHTPVCDSSGCTEEIDPQDRISVGSATAGYILSIHNGAPAALRGLPKPSAQFNHVSGLQATEPAFRPAPLWRMPVSATADRHKEFMFAMGNPYPEDTVVQGKLYDDDGVVLGTQTWTLRGDNTQALYLTNGKNDPTPGFGEDPFPEGQDCTCWLELRVVSPETGRISVVGLQKTGNTMSSADVQPFYPPAVE